MNSKLNKLYVIGFMLLLILTCGCKKEDYTLPAGFKLNIAIKNEAILGGTVTIDEIAIALNSIDIRGYREIGGDVFLTRNFDAGKIIRIKPSDTNIEENFDIPQGTYNPLSFSFILKPDAAENELTDEILDWLDDFDENLPHTELQEELGDIIEDYLNDVNPCILVKGNFMYNGKTKHIIIVANDPVTFLVYGKNKLRNAEVILDKDIVNYGNLEINPAYWFSAISPQTLNSSFTGLTDTEEYIFLSKHVNSQLYMAVFNRMEESTTLTINK